MVNADTLRELLEWYKVQKAEYEESAQSHRRNAMAATKEADAAEGYVRLYSALIRNTDDLLQEKPEPPIPF